MKHYFRPQDLYEEVTSDDVELAREVAQHTENPFVAATMLHHVVLPASPQRAVIIQQTAQQYQAALQNVLALATPQTTPEFIVDEAAHFYELYFEDLDVEEVRDQIRGARLETIPGTKTEKQEQYFNRRKISNNPQNVHDSEVARGIRELYQKVREKNQTMAPQNLLSLERVIRDSSLGAEKKRQALEIFHKMCEGHEVTTLESDERRVLQDVWTRIQSPENAAQRESLQDALLDSLAAAMEKNFTGQWKPVCANGRCDRVLTSLTLLDQEPELAKPIKTTEILRDEILSKSYLIVQNVLRETPEEVRTLYESGSEDPQVQTLEENMKQQIQERITQDYPGQNVQSFIQDAQAGV